MGGAEHPGPGRGDAPGLGHEIGDVLLVEVAPSERPQGSRIVLAEVADLNGDLRA
jgi:hypothetical protein